MTRCLWLEYKQWLWPPTIFSLLHILVNRKGTLFDNQPTLVNHCPASLQGGGTGPVLDLVGGSLNHLLFTIPSYIEAMECAQMQHYTEDRVARNAGGLTVQLHWLSCWGVGVALVSHPQLVTVPLVFAALPSASRRLNSACIFMCLCTGVFSSSSLSFHVLAFYLLPFLCVIQAG